MVPGWIKNLEDCDIVLCVFGFSGIQDYVRIENKVYDINDSELVGYWGTCLSNNDFIFLDLEKYNTDSDIDCWIAYSVL